MRTTMRQRPKDALRDDGADFTGRGAETVRGGAVARGEALARHDEGGCVGAEVEEELRDDVEAQKAVVGPFERLVGEADDDEDDGQDAEAAELDWFAADEVHRGDGHPVSGDGAGADQNEIADGVAVEVFVDVAAAGPADGAEDDGVVQTEAVER